MDAQLWVKFGRDRTSGSEVMAVCHKFRARSIIFSELRGSKFVTNWKMSRTATAIALKFHTELEFIRLEVWVKFHPDRATGC